MKINDRNFIMCIMKSPRATDEELAKLTGLSRSGAAKKRSELEQKGKLLYFAGPNLSNPFKTQITQGIITFSHAVCYEEVAKFARHLSKEDKFISLWIRRTDDNVYGLCFMYLNDTSDTFDKFLDDFRMRLQKEFGPDFVGINVSASSWWLKFMGQNLKTKFS